jgi:hypothetical protein
MGKRPGDDVLVASAESNNYSTNNSSPSPFFFSASNNHASSPQWIDSASFDHKLWVVRECLHLDSKNNSNAEETDDDFLAEVNACRANQQTLKNKHEAVKAASQQIKMKLMEQIEQEEANLQLESANLEATEKALLETVRERDSITKDLVELKRLGDHLQQKIVRALEEANQVVESIDSVEEARQIQVPRLKHQISLYANTTGIKWDFENKDNLLAGQVVSTI